MRKIIAAPGFKQRLTKYVDYENIYNVPHALFAKEDSTYDVLILRGVDIRQLIEKEEVKRAYNLGTIIITVNVNKQEIRLLHRICCVNADIEEQKERLFQYAIVKDQNGHIEQYYHEVRDISEREYEKESLKGTGLKSIIEWIEKITRRDKQKLFESISMYHTEDTLLESISMCIKSFVMEEKTLFKYYDNKTIMYTNQSLKEEVILGQRIG